MKRADKNATYLIKIVNAFNREIKMGMFENARRYKVTKREIAL